MCLRLLPKGIPFFLSFQIFISMYMCADARGVESLDDVVNSYREVTSFYQEKLRQNPQDIDLRIKLARFYYQFNDFQKVISLLKNTSSLEAKVILAKAYVRFKEYDLAMEIFEEIDNLTDSKKSAIKDSEYFYLWGEVLEKKNMFNEAVKKYKKVTGSFKEKAEARIKEIKLKTADTTPLYVKNLLSSAKGFLKKMSQEAAFIYLVDEEYKVTPENTTTSTIHVIEGVLKERGKEIAEVEIGYDSTYERVELVLARTITKEGRVIAVGKENIRDVSKYLNYPLYSNARAFIISMPSVDVGSIIEYKVKIYSSRMVNKDDFSFVYRLREKYPIFNARFRLVVPKGRDAHFKYFHEKKAQPHSLKPKIIEGREDKIYSWEFKHIEPIIPEYNMPPLPEVNPAIAISSFSSWSEVYHWWHKLFIDKLTLGEEAKKLVDGIISNTSDDLEKAKRIYEFCAKNIRYVAVEYGQSGYEPHPANDVFLNRYGDCKDQAILLIAMLRYANLKAYPVLIPTRGVYPISRDFPSINFNHAICVLDYKGELIFMDPTSETASFGDLPLADQKREVMVFKDKNAEIVSTPQREDNAVIYKTTVKLDRKENGIIEREVTTRGFYTAGYRWYLKHTHPDKIKEDIQRKMIEISSSSKLLDYEIKYADSFDKPPILYYRFISKHILSPAGKLRVVSVVDDIDLDDNLIGKDKRNFPIYFNGIYTKVSTVKIILPSNMRIKYMPEGEKLSTPHFSFSAVYKIEDNIITIKRSFKIKKRFVYEDEYPEFKKKMERVFFFLREKIILEEI